MTVIHSTEQHAGFDMLGLLSSNRARTQRLITAGYRDAKREFARRERARRRGADRGRKKRPAASSDSVGQVEPAFRQEVV